MCLRRGFHSILILETRAEGKRGGGGSLGESESGRERKRDAKRGNPVVSRGLKARKKLLPPPPPALLRPPPFFFFPSASLTLPRQYTIRVLPRLTWRKAATRMHNATPSRDAMPRGKPIRHTYCKSKKKTKLRGGGGGREKPVMTNETMRETRARGERRITILRAREASQSLRDARLSIMRARAHITRMWRVPHLYRCT